MRIREELRSFIIYGVGNLAQSASYIFLLPLFLSYFSPEEYGILNLLLISTLFVSLVLSSGLINSIQTEYFSQSSKINQQTLSMNVVVWLFLTASVLVLAIIPIADDISWLLFSKVAYYKEIIWSALNIPLLLIVEVPFNILRMEKRAGSYAMLSFIRVCVDLAFKYIFIVQLGLGIKGYFIANFLSLSFLIPLLLVTTRQYLCFAINTKQFARQLRLGAPLIVSGLMIWSLESIDRIMLKLMIDEASVGTYSVAANLSRVFNILLYRPVSLLLPPLVFGFIAENNNAAVARFLGNLLSSLIFVGIAMVCLVCTVSGDVLKIMVIDFGGHKQYLESAPLILPLVLSCFFYYATMPGNYVMLMIRKTSLVAKLSVVAAIINIVLNTIFIYFFGMVGASIGTASSYAVFFGLLYYYVHMLSPMNYRLIPIFISLSIMVPVLIFYYVFPVGSPYFSILTFTSLIIFLYLIAFVLVYPLSFRNACESIGLTFWKATQGLSEKDS